MTDFTAMDLLETAICTAPNHVARLYVIGWVDSYTDSVPDECLHSCLSPEQRQAYTMGRIQCNEDFPDWQITSYHAGKLLGLIHLLHTTPRGEKS